MPIITGTDGSDKISGTSGNDAIVGGKGVDYYYGGAGNDAFVIRLQDMDPTLSDNVGYGNQSQVFIYDFYGANGWLKGNNDFLHLQNFGEGSTLTFLGYGYNSTTEPGDTTAQYYNIYSTETGLNYVIALNSMNGEQLVLGDYNFYG